ncbi:hypothetical protein V8E55_007195 [Tylopilus felleus]
MTSQMLSLLVQVKRIYINTSFKHVHRWQEFEIEGWDNLHQRSCALTTSQSADAHIILFCHIFSIVKQDTGVPVEFLHIHGMGIKSVVDGHCGQALGLGKFCVEICRDNQQACAYEAHHHICDLNLYDHLWHFFCICVVHFKRNIQPLKHEVSHDVIEAMYSVASAEPHIDFKRYILHIDANEK